MSIFIINKNHDYTGFYGAHDTIGYVESRDEAVELCRKLSSIAYEKQKEDCERINKETGKKIYGEMKNFDDIDPIEYDYFFVKVDKYGNQ